MDGDLQDPPELIPEMVQKWKSGNHVVYTVKRIRKEHFFKRLLFRCFYLVMRKFSSIQIPLEAGNFSLMDRRVVDVLRGMAERNRYIPGMRAWAGFQQTSIEFDRDKRFAGQAKMSLRQLFKLGLDALFSFSIVPLRLATYVGASVAFLSFLTVIAALWAKIFTDLATPGWASVLASTLFMGGLILLTLGIIGEYLGRIYEEVKRRPLYTVRQAINFDADDD
jgi:dolichol-phosphate mannosyltransferase